MVEKKDLLATLIIWATLKLLDAKTGASGFSAYTEGGILSFANDFMNKPKKLPSIETNDNQKKTFCKSLLKFSFLLLTTVLIFIYVLIDL